MAKKACPDGSAPPCKTKKKVRSARKKPVKTPPVKKDPEKVDDPLDDRVGDLKSF